MKQKGTIKFTNKDRSDFYNTVRANVNAYFVCNNLSKHANTKMVFKTIILLSAYVIPYVLILVFHLSLLPLLLLFTLMGFAMAGIAMDIMHDANHGAYSSNKMVNTLLGCTINIFGDTAYNWKLQHNVLHHTFTNIRDMDDDLELSSALRLSPHQQLKPIHKYQHIYIFIYYALVTLAWLLVKDVIQLARYRKNGVDRSSKSFFIKTIFVLIFFKLLFVFYILIVPIVFFGYSFFPLFSGIIFMHIVSGLILGLTFQLAHCVGEVSFPLPNDNNEIENEWAIHQVNTTVDFAHSNPFVNWYIGGLNYQIEHHLFPAICHIHYKAISGIVKKTAEEHGIQYKENPTLGIAIRSHIETLKRFGTELSPIHPNPAA